MSALTWQALDSFPFARQADPGVIQRGRAFYKAGRVLEVDLLDDHTASCRVAGDSGEYEVTIQAAPKTGPLRFNCDCPHAGEGHFCKHMVAAALELKDYLSDELEDWEEEVEPPAWPKRAAPAPQTWRNKLDEALADGLRRSPPPGLTGYIGLLMLERARLGYSFGTPAQSSAPFTLTPVVIKAPAWSSLTRNEVDRPQAIPDYLQTHKNWIQVAERWQQPLDPAGSLNLGPAAVAFLNLLAEVTRTYSLGFSNLAVYLSMLARLDLPLFRGNLYARSLDRRVQVLPEPVRLQLDLQTQAKKISLRAGYEQGGHFIALQKPVESITHQPAWALLDDALAQVEDSRVLAALPSLPIDIPLPQAGRFRERYLAALAQAFPLRGNLIDWQDLRVDPVPRLYLRDDGDRTLRAELRFAYGDYEWPAAQSGEAAPVVSLPESWTLIRVQRQRALEQDYAEQLSGRDFGLKRANGPHPYGVYTLRARVHPFDFLLQSLPRLTGAGFEIYGEERLKLGKLNRAAPVLRLAITSGIDWFDLQTRVEFGDQQISLQAVRQALQHGERFIKLADGSVGQLPGEWLEKYKHLWTLAEETPEGFRLRDRHLSLIDALLEEDPSLRIPPDLKRRRERLRNFEQITTQPLPRNFTGELRPYQKHGVDWLHFLRDYKFGGILADDMGLGKTVQVLVYLQALKERARRGAPGTTLLVVPKSLIANWQREAEKFTPGLRLLEYLGNSRSQAASVFGDYEVVLTTYGTLLRDIERLRDYPFQTVILDESQAIKNPLAKGSRAVRLLQAEQRLALTGTPVENNTFELWSQFAFLNPGLLGSLEYFKREFANPIESGGDAQAAETLRKLVFPFILRRTKAQVAPELPPRTERILYVELDSAQRKIYNQTRERYRAELLGLIESDGLNDARFKILEGLLRLRQIAIHPALVDKKYTGPAPKFESLFETLATLQAENHKALIFSQFVQTLKLVRRELDARGTPYMYLDGQTADRQARVDLFQNDPACLFFLISLKAGGVGLNLTAADYVIHLDPWWNPAVEMQASDRAHRIGQTRPVFIYKLITRDTVEEKILQLQEKKRALVKSLIATEASFFKSLTQADVRLLFE